MMNKGEPAPNFTAWTTLRLQSLLDSYRSDLSSCKILLGKEHVETQTYQTWVNAMEEELAKRGPK